MESPSKSPGIHQRTVQAADDLVSVTVRKETPDQKAGISLVERQNAVYVTKIAENGLFYDTEVDVGDKVLSINGKRLKPGEGARHIIKHISKASATVTMVVKKAGITPSRGSRGGLIKRKPQRFFKKDLHRNEDGSLNAELDPRNLPTDDDDKDQIPIKGYKIFASQPVGVTLVDHNNMVFVAAISLDSIFRDSDLQIGDRVVAVNGMNFMAYADARMAMKKGEKSPKEVVFVVEKGHINIPDEVKRNLRHDDPSESPIKVNLIYDEEELDEDLLTMTPKANYSAPSSSSLWKSPGKSDSDSDESSRRGPIDMMARVLGRQANGDNCASNKSSLKSNSGCSPTNNSSYSNSFSNSYSNSFSSTPTGRRQRTVNAPTTPTRRATAPTPIVRRSLKAKPLKAQPLKGRPLGDDDDDEESSLDEDLVAAVTHVLSPEQKQGHESNASAIAKTQPDDYEGDYIRIKVEKVSEREPGIKFKKTEGMFILAALPDHEKRINVGVRILAINGVMNINTVVKAYDLMSRTKGHVMLMIDYSSPIEQRRVCPCCGDPMYANGEHVSGRKGHGRVKADDEMSILSTESSIYTAQAGNRKGSAPQRLPSVPRIAEVARRTKDNQSNANKYGIDHYDSGSDSDSDDDDEDGDGGTGRSINRSSTTRRHEPGEKFMIRVTRSVKNGPNDLGISLFDYKGDIYVGDIVQGGPFFTAAIEVGDKLLSINGRKAADIKSASNAMDIIEDRETVSMFLMRPDRKSLEYKDAMRKWRQ
jgi:C-terminal processing protease CtpA/Prc